MKTKYMSLDFAFFKLMENWNNLPRNFKQKYSSARSKHFNAEVGIGIGMKCRMLQEAGFVGVWISAEDKGGIL